ncbi:MAG: zinc-binding dehydrogenase, partial [Rhodocyclaceae bacterium]|nr:zinc-binding dehydrogenase [Rhodocyclaceae bacterium]
HLGATVIGTVASEEKMALAKANGCDYVINYRKEDFQARVMEITNGKKCQVVYDGVGQDTWAKSLDCIAPLGMMVSFGAASGAVKPFYIGELAAKGSLYLTRPTLDTYTATRADLVATTDELFAIVASGVVKIEVNQTYALRDTAQAHRDLEARKTTGSTVLIP